MLAGVSPGAAQSPAQVVAHNWSGLYVGVNAGYARRDSTARWDGEALPGASNVPLNSAFAGIGSFNPATYFQSLNANGFIGGGQLGYNWRFASIVVGMEADLQYANLHSTASNSGPSIFTIVYTATSEQRLRWFGTGRLRAGWLWADDRLLTYVTGGLAFGRTTASANVANVSATQHIIFGGSSLTCQAFATCLAGSDSRFAAGWTLGGGLEWALWGRTTVRGEYLHLRLSDQELRLTAQAPSIGTAVASVRIRNSYDVIRGAINYAF